MIPTSKDAKKYSRTCLHLATWSLYFIQCPQVTMLARLRHPNIVSLFGLAHHANTIYIVTEYIDYALPAAVEWDDFGCASMATVASQTLQALSFMHAMGMAHR